jgi:hypothetical protein
MKTLKALFRLLFVRPQINSIWKLKERFARVSYVGDGFVTVEVTSAYVGSMFLIVPMTDFLVAYEPAQILANGFVCKISPNSFVTYNFEKD